MKRKFLLLIIILLFTIDIVPIMAFSTSTSDIDNYRKAISETAHAYFRKGISVQYDSYRRNSFYSPEDASAQSTIYTVCSGFVEMVYYQTFGVQIEPYTENMINAASADIAAYKESTGIDLRNRISTSDVDGRFVKLFLEAPNGENALQYFTDESVYGFSLNKSGKKSMINFWNYVLEPGDILIAYNTKAKTGHTMLIGGSMEITTSSTYNLPYILEAGGERYLIYDHPKYIKDGKYVYFKQNNDYIKKNGSYVYLYYNEDEIENDGAIGISPMSSIINRYDEDSSPGTNLLIVLSYIDSGKYVRPLRSSEKKYPSSDNGVVNFTSQDNLTEKALDRLKYKNIDINKISIVENGYNNRNYVSEGDIITYRINIKNNSNLDYKKPNEDESYGIAVSEITYDSIIVSEKIDGNAEIVDYGGATVDGKNLTWNVPSLAPGASITIEYKAKVNNNSNGSYVTSSGKVGNIRNRTIRMYIDKSLTTANQQKILYNFNSYSESNYLNDFQRVNKIYEGTNIKVFDDALYSRSSIFEKTFVTSDIARGSYYNIDIKNKRIKNMSTNSYGLAYIRKAYSVSQSGTDTSDYGYDQLPIYWDDAYAKFTSRDYNSRVTEIVMSDFQIGDILLVDKETDALDEISEQIAKTADEQIYSEVLKKAYIYKINSQIEAYIYLNENLYKVSDKSKIEDINKFLNDLSGKTFVILRPAKLNTYTIRYRANNGTTTSLDQIVNFDENIILKANKFTKEGYIFKGWNTDQDGNGTAYNDKESVKNLTPTNGDIVNLYAIWEEIYSYIVDEIYNFDSNKKVISKISVNTLLNDFKKRITLNDRYSINVDYKEIGGKKVIYTGGQTKIYKNGILYDKLTNSVLGDTTGDGVVNIADVAKLYRYLRGKLSTMDECYIKAGNVVYTDDTILISDVSKLYRYIRGKITNLN